MKILLIVPLPPSIIGGIEEYAYNLYSELINNKDIEVTIVTSNPINITNLVLRPNISINWMKLNKKIKFVKSVLIFRRPIPIDIISIISITRDIIKYDIVHIFCPYPFVEFYFSLLSKIFRKKIVITYCCDALLDFMQSHTKLRRIFEYFYHFLSPYFALKLSDKIVVSSSSFINSSILLPRLNKDIEIIYQGINTQCKAINTSTNFFKKIAEINSIFNILFLGRLVKYKGVEYIIKAADIIINKEKNDRVHFFIAGSGDCEKSLKEMVKKLNLQNNVHFLGYVSDIEKWYLYSYCDLFVNASISPAEVVPITVLESLSVGTPVITSDSSGIDKKMVEQFGSIEFFKTKDFKQLSKLINLKIKKNYKKEKINVPTWHDVSNSYYILFVSIINDE